MLNPSSRYSLGIASLITLDPSRDLNGDHGLRCWPIRLLDRFVEVVKIIGCSIILNFCVKFRPPVNCMRRRVRCVVLLISRVPKGCTASGIFIASKV